LATINPDALYVLHDMGKIYDTVSDIAVEAAEIATYQKDAKIYLEDCTSGEIPS
jgi:hypothetical protein